MVIFQFSKRVGQVINFSFRNIKFVEIISTDENISFKKEVAKNKTYDFPGLLQISL